MARDILYGRSAKNFAIQGLPTLPMPNVVGEDNRSAHGAFHVKGGNCSCCQGEEVKELKLGTPEGFKIFDFVLFPPLQKISNTDWDAAKKWVANLAENVAYTRKVHGQKVLTDEEMVRWTAFWKRWLVFANKLDVVKKTLQADDSLAAKALIVTSPVLWSARLLGATLLGTMALMSTENKTELDGLLHEAWGLYSRFRLLGMSQVAVPYMGDLVVILRTLPKNPKLVDMAQSLQAAAKTGSRLIDENTAWWEWKVRPETKGLRNAIAEAGQLAADILSITASTDPNAGLPAMAEGRQRLVQLLTKNANVVLGLTPGQALKQLFSRAVSKIYIEAAGLYGIQETKATAKAETFDEARKGPEKATSSLGWVLAAIGVGYLGIRLLTRDKTTIIVQDTNPAYHPEEEMPTTGHHEYESEDSHGIR
jgi:hypothetical protein